MQELRKKHLFLFPLFFFFLLFSACKEHSAKELITNVEGELLFSDSIVPLQLVVKIQYENVNTRQRGIYEVDERNYQSYSVALLKGIYNVTVDGTIIYMQADSQIVKNIRGYSEGLLFLNEKETCKLTLYTYN